MESEIQAGQSNSPTSKIQLIRYLKESLETASTLTLCKTLEDVAIFIGTTKSGKSTLLNSLLGNELIGEKEPKLRSISIVKANNDLGPQIGRGPTSETIYPSRWVSSEKLSGLVLWDSPGFEDNRGPIQDIINAYYVYRLFGNINSAKIVLVTDVNDILNDRINPFLSLLTSVENLFKDKLNNCFSNIVVVFTKVPNNLDGESVNVDFISDVLDHQILSSDGMAISQSTRSLIKHLTKNHKQIGLFKKASIGPIPRDADAEIVQAIRSTKGVQRDILKTVSPSIAHASQVFLFKVRHQLISSDSFMELETSVKSAFKEKTDQFKLIAKSEQSQSILSVKKKELILFKKQIQAIIDADSSFHNKIESLEKIDPKFKNKIDANNLLEQSKIMQFIDGILGLKESKIFNVGLRSTLETTKSEVNEIIIDMEVKLHEIDIKEAQEQLEQVRKTEQENKRQAEEERKEFEKENKEIEKKLFARVGEKIGEAVDDICENVTVMADKIFNWF